MGGNPIGIVAWHLPNKRWTGIWILDTSVKSLGSPSTHTHKHVYSFAYLPSVAGLPLSDLLFEGTRLTPSHLAEGGNYPEARQSLQKLKKKKKKSLVIGLEHVVLVVAWEYQKVCVCARLPSRVCLFFPPLLKCSYVKWSFFFPSFLILAVLWDLFSKQMRSWNVGKATYHINHSFYTSPTSSQCFLFCL